MKFEMTKQNEIAAFLIEQESYEGIKMIGNMVASDVESVCNQKPSIYASLSESKESCLILIATLGHSPLLNKLSAEGKVDLSGISGKREVYLMKLLESPFPEAPQAKHLMVIAGSDKRGTIYGAFRLSELCGVSPLVFWGDAVPVKQGYLCLDLPEIFVSKEPSVKYRGFFINDEWPAFGNWCMEKFGGVNAKAYEKVFELLLRLKGNYLWPAMWRSSFSDDGPGLGNAKLADTLGVIMGTSHHEPLCRAGLEWQRDYKKYGTDHTWSFISNSDAITRFWEDGIARNKDFENVITIGMRGENDSKLLPADATLSDNVAVIKKAITVQNEILRKTYSDDLKDVPRMLAIYKEVEDYYNGDDSCQGLKDWEELQDVIFLLADDNYGNLRNLPDQASRNHPGGFGMYYHFDYHGAPVSYEWMNCNRLTKTWEQMTQAYEAGVREMWIVNVGDIKGVEYPLCYFLELAYDYETWGITAPNKTKLFEEQWITQQFGSRLSDSSRQKLIKVMEGYTKWNSIRSPESMNADVYHPTHFRECERIATEIETLLTLAEELRQELCAEALSTYLSIFHYTVISSLSNVLACVHAGMNKLLATRGCISANYYGDLVKKYIRKDQEAVAKFHEMMGGKWNHFMCSAHTGFHSWDDNNWTYPTTQCVTPIFGGKAVISFRGSDAFHVGAHWQDNGPLFNDDMTRNDVDDVLLDLDSRGEESYSFEVKFDAPWLSCDAMTGRVETSGICRNTICFHRDKAMLNGRERALVTIQIQFDDGKRTFSRLELEAEGNGCESGVQTNKTQDDGRHVFLERQGYCCIPAKDFVQLGDVLGNGFRVIDYLGRESSAIKAFPPMAYYPDASKAPFVRYEMIAEQDGEYVVKTYLMARNPVIKGERSRFALSVNNDAPIMLYAVSENYYTEWFNQEWARGVIDHGRVVSTTVTLKKGKNDVFLYAGEPGVIVEKIVLHPANITLPDSLLGPAASCTVYH